MTALGLRRHGRLGLSPGGRRAFSFLPDQIADLAMWWRAGGTQNTVTSGAVEQAFDLSGNGRHLGNGTAAERPLDTVDPDGRPVMRFDGADDRLTTALAPSLSGGVTVFMAYRNRADVGAAGLLSVSRIGIGLDAGQMFAFYQNTLGVVSLDARTTQGDPGNIDRTDPYDRGYAVFTIDATSMEYRDLLGVATDTTSPLALGTPDIVAMGARSADDTAVGNFAAVDVYEAGLYPRVLTAAELDQIEAYLRLRHGIGWSPGYLPGLAWWHDHWSDFTLTGALVDQWNDRSQHGRPWTASGSARPSKTTDAGNVVVRFDGTDDALDLGGAIPPLEPFSVAVVYRMRNRVDFEGVLSAAAVGGIDHQSFWTFENASAASNNMQLFGRSLETDQLALTRIDGGVAQVAIWTADAGTATLRDRTGQVSDTYGGSFGTPAAIVLGARYNAGPFNHAAVDVMATVGVTSVLSAGDQQQLIDWATAKWGV